MFSLKASWNKIEHFDEMEELIKQKRCNLKWNPLYLFNVLLRWALWDEIEQFYQIMLNHLTSTYLSQRYQVFNILLQ